MENDQRPETQQSDGIELQRPDLRQFTCCYHRDQSWNHHNSADDHQLSAYHQQRPTGSVPFPPEIEPEHADNGRSQESVRAGFKSDPTENDGESISHRVEGGLQVKRFGSGRHGDSGWLRDRKFGEPSYCHQGDHALTLVTTWLENDCTGCLFR